MNPTVDRFGLLVGRPTQWVHRRRQWWRRRDTDLWRRILDGRRRRPRCD